jgi:hypothetical protein
VADDRDLVAVVLPQHLGQLVHGRLEGGLERRAAEIERDLVGHRQLQQIVAHPFQLDRVIGALARQLLAQLRLLAVHQISDAGAGRGARGSADDRAAHPVALVEAVAEHAAGERADTRADRGPVHRLGAVRVRGAGGEQQGTQSRARLHAHSRFLHGVAFRARSMGRDENNGCRLWRPRGLLHAPVVADARLTSG